MTDNKTIWLIDDDELSNYLTENTIKLYGITFDVRFFIQAQQALAELNNSLLLKTFPDLIFLDLNMPVMDGWAFLEAYRMLPEKVKDHCTLYILSSSVDEEDINRSKLYEDVRDFLTKPLTNMDLEVVHFQTGKLGNNI